MNINMAALGGSATDHHVEAFDLNELSTPATVAIAVLV
jgi:hypothetical protein